MAERSTTKGLSETLSALSTFFARLSCCSFAKLRAYLHLASLYGAVRRATVHNRRFLFSPRQRYLMRQRRNAARQKLILRTLCENI